MIGFGQKNTAGINAMKDVIIDSFFIEEEKKNQLNEQDTTNLYPNNKNKSISIPYPIIFIHGWCGDSYSWGHFVNEIYNGPLGYSFGGYLEFCLNGDSDNSTSNISEIVFHMPTLTFGNFYVVNFDCSPAGSCNTNISSSYKSNQSAVVKQGRALGMAVDAVLNATGKGKVILMAHSMGGLAAREYITNSYHWQGNSNHRVAKLITSATPHGGSNATGLGFGSFTQMFGTDYDMQSESVRDLRRSYFTPLIGSGNPGAYLFGGYESHSAITNGTNYYNVDVNCDGATLHTMDGLNQKPYYINLEYACIYSDYILTTSLSSNSLRCDAVVGTYEADLSNYNPNIHYELFKSNDYVGLTINSPPNGISDYWHKNITSDTKANYSALDEPDEYELAYEIDLNSTYQGTLTHQGNSGSNIYSVDYDDYKFFINQTGNLTASVNNIEIGSVISIYDYNNSTYLGSSPVFTSSATISLVLNPGIYILEIEGPSLSNNVIADIYTFNTSFTSTNTYIKEDNNKIRSLIKITDLLGRETKGTKNQPLIYLYNDGTVEKRITID